MQITMYFVFSNVLRDKKLIFSPQITNMSKIYLMQS
jgi:hypothetical protein